VGFDQSGNALEIMGVMKDNTFMVIHAMKLRSQFFYLLGENNG
jgi:hypothetical protein